MDNAKAMLTFDMLGYKDSEIEYRLTAQCEEHLNAAEKRILEYTSIDVISRDPDALEFRAHAPSMNRFIGTHVVSEGSMATNRFEFD